MFIRFDNPFSPRDKRHDIFDNYILSSDVTFNMNQIKEIKVYQPKNSSFWRVSFSYESPTSPQYKPFTVFTFPDRNIVIHYYENLLSELNDTKNKNKVIFHSSLFTNYQYGDDYCDCSVLMEMLDYENKYKDINNK